MKNIKSIFTFILFAFLLVPSFAVAEEKTLVLDDIVVTAPVTKEPLTVEINPRAAQTFMPASDGADYLKIIPGLTTIRKGGADSDPVLRGSAGSRLGILLNGQEILGGCNSRMDPPTAYVYPTAYDRIVVRKGPQSVIYGSGYLAGTAHFESDFFGLEKTTHSFRADMLAGSYGRNDQLVDFLAGNETLYTKATLTRSHSNDYKDGDGNEYHSFYTRESKNLAIGFTPGSNTLIELSAIESDGEAAYADRILDGAQFDRENYTLKFEQKNISSVLNKVEASGYYSYIDHVMDNFSLRDPLDDPAMMIRAMNPDRIVRGGRVATTLTLGDSFDLILGADKKNDVHRSRMAMGMIMMGATEASVTNSYESATRRTDMLFEQQGYFGEATKYIGDKRRLIAGIRFDDHEATDRRSGSTQYKTTDDKLTSGFIRYERDFSENSGTYFFGVGHGERFPDYWERIKTYEATGANAFDRVKPETLTQVDAGFIKNFGKLSTSLSAFYGETKDYVLIDWTNAATRNIDAIVFGMEGDIGYKFTDKFSLTATFSLLQGENDTDDKYLAQQPAHEGTLTAKYDNKKYFVNAMWRVVDKQDKINEGSGSIVGKDFTKSGGYTIASLSAGSRVNKNLNYALGMDNVFNKKYSEHLTKAADPSLGVNTVQINEPGRTVWFKLSVDI